MLICSYAHLSQDVSSARPPVDAGLAEPPLLLLHHQRLRPACSSGKIHLLKHFLNFFEESLASRISVSTVSTFCSSTFSAPPVCCQKIAYWRLHCSRLPALLLRPSGKIWSTRHLGSDLRQLDSTTPLVVQTSMTHRADVIIHIVIDHMQQEQQDMR